MNTIPLWEGVRTKSSLCDGTVTRDMVHARAAELAFIDGRLFREVTMADFAQAKRELTGEPDFGS